MLGLLQVMGLVCYFYTIPQIVTMDYWKQRELNSQPSECKSDALPIELCPQ